METLKQLRQKLDGAKAAFKAYQDSIGANLMSAEQETEYSRLKAERDGFSAAVKRVEDEQEYDRTQATTAVGFPVQESVTAGKNRAEDKPWEGLGAQLMAVKEYGQTRGHVRDPRLFAALGQNETIDSEGGFLVAPDFASDLLTRTFSEGLITSRCRIRPMSSPRLILNGIEDSNRVGGPAGAGFTVYRIAEAQRIDLSKMKFRRVELNANKLVGAYAATDEIMEDAPALQAEIQDYFPEAFSWKLDNEVINGTGQGQFLGIINSGATVVAPKGSGQAPGSFTTQNALDMRARLWVRSRANATWIIGPDIESQLFPLTIPGPQGTAVALYTPPGTNGSVYGKVLGLDVLVVEQTAAAGVQGDVLLADLSQYIIGERNGLKFASSIHVAFLTDEQVFRWTLRNDGQPLWDKPVTQNNSANKVSPFVVLQSR